MTSSSASRAVVVPVAGGDVTVPVGARALSSGTTGGAGHARRRRGVRRPLRRAGRGAHAAPARSAASGPGPGRKAARGVAACAAAVLCLAAAVVWGSADEPATRVQAETAQLTIAPSASLDQLVPGTAVTGSLLVTNASDRPRRVSLVEFGVSIADEPLCRSTAVALAPTLEAPLDVPARGTAVVDWTAYMDANGDHACQGATLTSSVSLDGEPAGSVTLTAGTLQQPSPPSGGLTTSTRVAVHWGASTVADPGWVLERAVAGTDDWQPACGSSAARPLRALACTDTGLAGSTTYVYRVTLRTGHWHATSRPSTPVTTQERPSP